MKLNVSVWPWSISKTKKEVSVLSKSGDLRELVVALCRGPKRSENANLLATAPEMYDVLKDLHYWTGRGLESGNDDSDVNMIVTKIAECRDRARAILTAASGENETQSA